MMTTIDHKFIKEALLIRTVEEKLFSLFSQDKIHGTIHTCVGQEFSGVAFASHLKADDFIFSNHRCHGHYISFTKDYQGLIAELLGKETGVCGGIGSSQHIYNRNFFSNGIQGGMVPVAAGVALANKLKKNDSVVLAFIGDGTLGQGVIYETMNIASLWHLPLMIICENNYYAQSTRQADNLAGDIIKRAEAFGIKTYKSNTWELDDLFKNAATSIDHVRKTSSPVFHLVDTYRLYPHSKGDDHRNKDEVDRYKAIDPLNVFGKENPESYKEYFEEIEIRVNEAIAESLKAPELGLKKYHEVSMPDKTPAKLKAIEEIDTRQVELINNFFDSEMNKNSSIVFLGEDVLSPYGGAFKVAKTLSEKYPDRVFSTPISEDAITGIANGLALGGFRPFLEIMFGDFIALCMNQIINHASKFYHMYNKQIKCPIVIRTPMGGRRGFGPTHSQALDKFLVGIDNVTTVALNTLIDPRLIYQTILKREEHPVIVIENKTDYAKKIAKKRIKNYKYETTVSAYPVARLSPEQSAPNATIVTYGGAVDIVLEAVEPLFTELEVKPEIVVLSKIHPIDYKEIIDSVSRTKRLFVIEEGSPFAGIGSEIISSLTEVMADKIIARRLSALPVPIPSAKSLENLVLPSIKTIVAGIREALA
jgi:2-oxoisovalerate dehydrogenase E1 component